MEHARVLDPAQSSTGRPISGSSSTCDLGPASEDGDRTEGGGEEIRGRASGFMFSAVSCSSSSPCTGASSCAAWSRRKSNRVMWRSSSRPCVRRSSSSARWLASERCGADSSWWPGAVLSTVSLHGLPVRLRQRHALTGGARAMGAGEVPADLLTVMARERTHVASCSTSIGPCMATEHRPLFRRAATSSMAVPLCRGGLRCAVRAGGTRHGASPSSCRSMFACYIVPASGALDQSRHGRRSPGSPGSR